ncbi:MAG TPA: class I SAM-dependent methyltransferase [Terriglobia bacterium]|nr:class I SAM-dependent methyltransferase [Terriglobia bacterium]
MKAGLEQACAPPLTLPVMEAHALWAATYDDGSNPLLTLEERVMEPLLPDLKDTCVLDVACGTGRWLRRLRACRVAQVFGVDLSQEMLRVGSVKPAIAGTLVRADCFALPLRNFSSHLIICSFAVSYLADLPALAREFARVSRPFARVLISDFHPDGYRRGWKRSFHFGGRAIEIASFNYSIGTVCEAFENAGFVLLRKVESHFDEPERGIFVRAGKRSIFESIRKFPALFILEFQLSRGNGMGTELR